MQTIIEALKYGITNSFPPNSKLGSSFVNDPKLTNGYEVIMEIFNFMMNDFQ